MRYAIPIVLLACGLAHAEGPDAVVTAPASVPAGGAVIFDARASKTSLPLAWQVVEPTDAPLIAVDQGGRGGVMAFLVADPKVPEYIVAVTAAAVDDKTKAVTVDTAVCRIRTGTSPPSPPPNPPPGPLPVTDGVALGRSFAPILGSTYGDAWLAAAQALEQGKTVQECQKILQAQWQDSRSREFTKYVTPAFASLLPEGSEPSDAAKRAQVIAFWRDFGQGLKSSR